MRDEQTGYQKKGVTTLGINPAAVDSHEKYTERLKLNFPLCSDPGLEVARRFRALKPDADRIARTVYLIGQGRKVLFAQRGAPPADAILSPLD